MTTKVRIQYPTPNHLPFKVTAQLKNEDGTWRDSDIFELTKERNWVEMYVHQFQRFVIEEVQTELPASTPQTET